MDTSASSMTEVRKQVGTFTRRCRRKCTKPALRVISGALIPIHLLSVFPATVMTAGAGPSNSSAAAPLQRTPVEVLVNRTIPPHVPASQVPQVSNDPTDEEIGRLRLFGHQLVPVEPLPKSSFGALFGNKPAPKRSPENNQHAVATLRTLQRSTDPGDTTVLGQFIASHPQSRWTASLRHELNRRKFQQGFFKEAVAGWETLWDELKDRRDSAACQVADETLSHLLEAYIGFGNADQLARLIGDEESRPGNGVIASKLPRANQAVWLYKHRGSQNVMCGPQALYAILQEQGRDFVPIRLNDVTDDHIATGLSLKELKDYSDRYALNLVMARRTDPNAPIPVPCVIHLSAGHYSAITARDGDKYMLVDRAMRFNGWSRKVAVDAQASGYFLVPRDSAATGWQLVSDNEGKNIFGRDGLHGQEPTGLAVTETAIAVGSSGPQVGGSCQAPSTQPMTAFDRLHAGRSANMTLDPNRTSISFMPRFSLNPAIAAMRIDDIPVGYTPPIGPGVGFAIAYNDRDDSKPASSPTYSNVGRMWSINWIAYVDHIAGALSGSSVLTVHVSGGGIEQSAYNTTTGQFGSNDRSFATVVRSGASTNTYTRTLLDGSKEIYNSPDNPLAPSRVFLTQRVDPQGNALTFTYDSNLRLVGVTDAIGQVTSLEYSLGTNSFKVTKVTDPFGRFATFAYDGTGNLTNVTDVIGLSSSFAYGASEFITSMTTPYGTTSFTASRSVIGSAWNYDLVVTDPNGDRERVQYIEPINIPFTGSAIPSSYTIRGSNVTFYADNGRLAYRNSFYWNKKAMKDAPDDINAARNYRWFTDNSAVVSSVVEAIKDPFEDRVWFNYPGQVLGSYSFKGATPEKTLRFLPGGVPQLTQNYYNALGKPTRMVDPLGRATVINYATNLFDPVEILQYGGGTNYQRLASFSWNAQHLPLTTTNTAGQASRFTYNSRGQPLTVTNPRGEVTTFNYDTNGYLTSLDNPLAGTNDSTVFTYDGFGRTRTVTGPDGYSITFDYDNGDRPTVVTYPDGTYEQFTYNRLDLVTTRDRVGRITTSTYDSLGRVTQVTDPLNRVTRFDWCKCGSLNALIDPLTRVTQWLYDVQGRTTAKVYADGSQIRYLYETNTSRLRQVIDEKGQITTYNYDLDNSVAQITYSNAPIATPSIMFTHDINYARTISMTDGIGTTTYTYYPVAGLGANQLAAVDGPLTNDTVTYFYDQLGRITNRAINGVSMVMTFDALGRVTSSTNILGSFSYTYDGPTARLLSATYPNGQTTTLGYYGNTGDRRLQAITNSYGATLISRFAYAYNPVGNITNWTQQLGATNPTSLICGYDAADQLISAVRTDGTNTLKSCTYTYDPAANRTSETIDAQTRQFAYNVLNEIATEANGTNTPATYEWDAIHRLVAINHGTNRSEFSYDGLGRRVRMVEKQNGVTVDDRRFVWCGMEICEERDATGAIVQKRHFGQGTQLASGPSAGNYFNTRDHLGSLREMVDASGGIHSRYDYAPYGSRAKLGGDLDADWGFTGHFHHARSALHLALYRSYDSGLSRWLSRDPIGEIQRSNLYAYVANNPISRRDGLGLADTECTSKEREDRTELLRDFDYAIDCEKGTSGASALKWVGFGLKVFGKAADRTPGKLVDKVVDKAMEKAAGGSIEDMGSGFYMLGGAVEENCKQLLSEILNGSPGSENQIYEIYKIQQFYLEKAKELNRNYHHD